MVGVKFIVYLAMVSVVFLDHSWSVIAEQKMEALATECSQKARGLGNVIQFTLKGTCKLYTCNRTFTEDNRATHVQAQLTTKGCESKLFAISPCHIQKIDTSQPYPRCCPKIICPPQESKDIGPTTPQTPI